MSGSTVSSGSSGPPYREKREVPRFGFIADVALTEPATDTRISGRISEISRKGCYVDVLNTLPEGTHIELKISRDQGVFATKGRIIYVQPGMGMGVAFIDIPSDQLKVLDAWLKELAS
jgi:PilZ domain